MNSDPVYTKTKIEDLKEQIQGLDRERTELLATVTRVINTVNNQIQTASAYISDPPLSTDAGSERVLVALSSAESSLQILSNYIREVWRGNSC